MQIIFFMMVDDVFVKLGDRVGSVVMMMDKFKSDERTTTWQRKRKTIKVALEFFEMCFLAVFIWQRFSWDAYLSAPDLHISTVNLHINCALDIRFCEMWERQGLKIGVKRSIQAKIKLLRLKLIGWKKFLNIFGGNL